MGSINKIHDIDLYPIGNSSRDSEVFVKLSLAYTIIIPQPHEQNIFTKEIIFFYTGISRYSPLQFILKNLGRFMSLGDYSNQHVLISLNSCIKLKADKAVAD